MVSNRNIFRLIFHCGSIFSSVISVSSISSVNSFGGGATTISEDIFFSVEVDIQIETINIFKLWELSSAGIGRKYREKDV